MDRRSKKIRRKKVKKMLRAVLPILLVVILIVCGIMCIKLISSQLRGNQSDNEDVVSEDIIQETVTDELTEEISEEMPAMDEKPIIEPEIIEEPEIVELTISAAGDCTIGTDKYFNYSTSFAGKYDEVKDPGYFFAKVKHIFEADDLTIINFEGTLTESNSRKDKKYAFKGDPEYATILTEGSVEAANLANNHAFDYGQDAYEDTKKYLSEAGIVSFGYDRNAIMEIKGIKVGLVGILELPYGVEAASLLKEDIANVKAEGAQLIIVSFHWGTEKEHYPDWIQKELGHIAIDEGAHLVIGHHPHVLQGIEEYKGRNIVYSLGNFCFGGNKNPSDKDTMIFQQTFTFSDGVLMEDNVKEIIPCSLSSRSDKNNYQPMVLEGSEQERVMEKILKYSEGLSS